MGGEQKRSNKEFLITKYSTHGKHFNRPFFRHPDRFSNPAVLQVDCFSSHKKTVIMANKKTTYHGVIFIIGVALIVAAAIVFGVSEYTKDPKVGQNQENVSIVLFLAGFAAFFIGPRLGGRGD